MKIRPFALCALGAITALSLFPSNHLRSPAANPLMLSGPPSAPVRPVTDDYFGTKITDPYRYMENLNDPYVQEWMKTQNDYTHSVLAKLPGRGQLLARIAELDQSVPRVAAIPEPGDRYLIFKQLAGEDFPKLYLRQGLQGDDKLLLDPAKIEISPSNRAKGKGRNAFEDIREVILSGDGKYVAAPIVPGGAENDTELHVIETATGRETGDVIFQAVGQEQGYPTWLPDNRSFVYSRYQRLPSGAPVTEEQEKYRAYLHVLGADPEKDPAVFGFGVVPSISVDPRYMALVRTPPESKYAIGILNGSVTINAAFYIEPMDALRKSNNAWTKVADFSDLVASVVVHGDDLYLLTYKDSPRYKILRTDARRPNLASAETVVPSGEAVITEMSGAQDGLYVTLLDGGINRILRVPYDAHPAISRLALPADGTAVAITDPRVPGAQIFLTSWTMAGQVYAYNPQTHQLTNTNLQPLGLFDHPDSIESVEVKARSYDGTMVPLSIINSRGIKLDGSHPTLLAGYGSYGVSITPDFDPSRLAWFESGGVRATCHVRGGGEYGEEWHRAGTGPTKPNTWRDFIACAQYLIEHGYTSPERLAGTGGSAGGILIGRAITERPDLFSAAVINVGALDMLRYETTANGVSNIPEFGSTKTKGGFDQLWAMSSYHHVKEGTRYPGVLLTTGANDPRVAPWETAKMTARLQAATSSAKPILLRVDYAGGHGGGSGAEQSRERSADLWSFVLWQAGIPGFQPPKQ